MNMTNKRQHQYAIQTITRAMWIAGYDTDRVNVEFDEQFMISTIFLDDEAIFLIDHDRDEFNLYSIETCMDYEEDVVLVYSTGLTQFIKCVRINTTGAQQRIAGGN